MELEKILRSISIVAMFLPITYGCGSGNAEPKLVKPNQNTQQQSTPTQQSSTGSSTSGHSKCLDLSQAHIGIYPQLPSDYLGSRFSNLIIEIDYNTQNPPSQNVLNRFQRVLEERIQPKNIIFRVERTPQICQNLPLTLDDVRRVEALTRDEHTVGTTLTHHTLWFKEAVANLAINAAPAYSFYFEMDKYKENEQTNMLMHGSSGHGMLGLVGRGTQATSQHQVPGDTIHCITPGCIMNPYILFSLGSYCQPCKDDIIANGGR